MSTIHHQIIVAGIGTEIGKTVASAVLVEMLQADYWKPVQSGALTDSDTDTVRGLISNPTSQFHPETYRLTQPLSPHAAAELDGITLDLDAFVLPKTQNSLVVELAGGLMVPLNNHTLNLDLVQRLGLPVILISRNYLGSINHTLLSIDVCRSHALPIVGILFNGPTVPATEEFILNYTGLPCLGRIGQEERITKAIIKKYAHSLSPSFHQIIEPLQ